MKLFKKISALGVAAVMGCSVFAFAACNPDDNSGNGGNGGNGGGNGAVTGENAALINGALTQEINALTGDFKVTVNVSDAAYNYADGVKGTEINGSKSETVSKSNIGVKANLETGDVDVDYVATDKDSTGEYVSYSYVFLRSGHFFVLNEEEVEITDFSKVTLAYVGALKDFMQIPEGGMTPSGAVGGALAGALEGVKIEEEIGTAFEGLVGAESYSVMALANAFNALTVENGKATADLNKAVFNAAKAVKDFVNGISLEMTVGEILNDATVKGVLTPYINLITPAELVKAVKDSLKAPEGADAETKTMYEAIAGIADSVLLEPNENETTWDYIVRVISSQELLDVVNGMLAQMGQGTASAAPSSSAVAIDKTLDKCTLGFALGIFGITKEQFDAMLGGIKEEIAAYCENITATSVKIETSRAQDPDSGNGYIDNYNAYNATTFENIKIVYSLSNNEITGQAITGKITTTEGHTGHSDDPSTTSTVWSETVSVSEIEATIKYADSVTLADIGEAATIEAKTVFESETNNIGAVEGLTVTSNVTDGKITGLTVKLNSETLEFVVGNDGYYWHEFSGDGYALVYEKSDEDCYYFYSYDDSDGMVWIDAVYFNGTRKYYANTVAGILAGTASTPVTDAE